MREYVVVITETTEKSITVFAESEEDAYELAWDREYRVKGKTINTETKVTQYGEVKS